ncbi:MAG TPA: response regulator transcription factor [Terriglobales bacterium]|nr:response regulator transcription factor [Terriglobales bacterium]
MGRPGVLLADDHTLVLEAFKRLLEPEFDIVGTVSDGRALLSAAPRSKPDVIVLDIGMPELSGMEAGLELKRLLPGTKLIVLTMCEDPDLAREALRNWASGYLLKKSAASELVKAIREALRGRSYVTPKIAQRLQDEFVRDPRTDRQRELTTRQREVLQLLAEGRTMKETANQLHVTPRTIAFHKYRIMEDFGLKNNSELVKFAIRERVISPV